MPYSSRAYFSIKYGSFFSELNMFRQVSCSPADLGYFALETPSIFLEFRYLIRPISPIRGCKTDRPLQQLTHAKKILCPLPLLTRDLLAQTPRFLCDILRLSPLDIIEMRCAPCKTAVIPSSSSILSSLLYFAMRSLLESEPVLIIRCCKPLQDRQSSCPRSRPNGER